MVTVASCGPWKVDEGDYPNEVEILDVEGKLIAQVYARGQIDEQEANAKLMANAWAMKRAIDHAIRMVHAGEPHQEIVRVLEAALCVIKPL